MIIEDHAKEITVVKPADLSTLPVEKLTPRQRALLLSIREALRLILSAIEDYAGIERTVERRRK